MMLTLRQRFHDARRHAFSPGGLLLRAAVIVAVFGVLHAFGLRECMSALCGTDASAGEAPRSTLQLAVLYLLAYLGAVVLAPIAVLTALFLKLSALFGDHEDALECGGSTPLSGRPPWRLSFREPRLADQSGAEAPHSKIADMRVRRRPMTPRPRLSSILPRRHAACGCLAPTPRLPRLPIAAAVLVLLLLAAQSLPAVVRCFFCAPSAWLSAQFLGVDVLPAADGFQLDCSQLPVDVSLACSGTTFFAMLLVLLTVHELGQTRGGPRARARRQASLLGAGSLLALAYFSTLAANTARIVIGWHAAVWAHAALPPAFHSGVHLAVGIVVFSSFLAAVVLATRWNPNTIRLGRARASGPAVPVGPLVSPWAVSETARQGCRRPTQSCPQP